MFIEIEITALFFVKKYFMAFRNQAFHFIFSAKELGATPRKSVNKNDTDKTLTRDDRVGFEKISFMLSRHLQSENHRRNHLFEAQFGFRLSMGFSSAAFCAPITF